MAEIRDLYLADRVRSGQTQVRGDKIPDDLYVVIVHVALFNYKQQLLIQRRSPTHSHWPGVWDISCGGSTIAGETSREAAQRELFEELGLKLELDNRPQFSMSWTNGFDDVYTLRLPGDFRPEDCILQPEEVAEVRFATLQDVLELYHRGEFFPHRESMLRLLFAMQDQSDNLIPDREAVNAAKAKAHERKNAIVLVEPEIHANTGNVSRTCVVTGTALHLVKPLGFSLEDKHLKRAGLDYWPDLDLTVWESLEEFEAFMEEEVRSGVRVFYGSTKGSQRLDEMNILPQEPVMLICGKETAGLPEPFLAAHPERCVRLPMGPKYRSLNLSNAAAILLYEALRQQGYPGLW